MSSYSDFLKKQKVMEEVKVRHFAEADQPDMPMHLRNMIILGVANSQI